MEVQQMRQKNINLYEIIKFNLTDNYHKQFMEETKKS